MTSLPPLPTYLHTTPSLTHITFLQTVILDPTGKVIANYNHDAAVGRSVDEILRIVQAFQYVEKHGEVCPAGWTPGKKTMKDDVNIAQKEYFSQLK